MQGSDVLRQTELPYGETARKWYLTRAEKETAPPAIAYSNFISKKHVELLMRQKKGSALGVKFEPKRRRDAITNMEGALHTFVTPVASGLIFGIHAWKGGHTVVRFGTDSEKRQLAMPCLLSGMIHQDFEYNNIMAEVFSCDRRGTTPSDGQFPDIISVEAKQDVAARNKYDAAIKAALVYHLREAHALPTVEELIRKANNYEDGYRILTSTTQATNILQDSISYPWADCPDYQGTQNVFIEHRRRYISLEMLINTAIHQISNEFAAIETICKDHEPGWIYTFNPPAIFARWWDAESNDGGSESSISHKTSGTEFMSFVWWTALRRLVRQHALTESGRNTRWNIRTIAWDDFATPILLRMVLGTHGASIARPWIRTVPLSSIYDKTVKPWLHPKETHLENRLFRVPKGCEGAILVLHNNSDAFGQNIETEGESGSLDGAMGVNSNMAACLLRQRRDLLYHLVVPEAPLCWEVKGRFLDWRGLAKTDRSQYPDSLDLIGRARDYLDEASIEDACTL